MKFSAIFLTAVSLLALNASELLVDYDLTGKKQSKSVFPDFKTALKAAKEGDTIKILKVNFPIRDCIRIKNKSNITVDAMFNTFTGLEKAKKENWNMVSPGLWKRDVRIPQGNSFRYFMVIDGKLNRMGRFFKAPCKTKYKKPAELKKNEWTIIKNPGTQKKRTFLYSIYLKINENISDITKAGIEEPRIEQTNGVDISGKCRNIHIKNVVCRNFWNDGFNIHNSVCNATFDTVCAIDCGDDGISAHEDSKISVKNFISLGNSTGICHIQQVTAKHNNCYIEGALGSDIYFKSAKDNKLDNSFKNVYVKTSSARGVFLGGATQDKLVVDGLTVVLAAPDAKFLTLPEPGADFSLRAVNVLRKEPESMTNFKKELFSKFGKALNYQED